MIKRILASFAVAGAVAAAVLAGPVSPASAVEPNSVSNSGYSSMSILACQPGECATVPQGGQAWENGYWNPTSVAVCPYCVANYRVIKNGHVLTGWIRQDGGRYGTWIDLKPAQWNYGGGVEVHVLMAGPYY